ncbi:IclR family transcriptional regulator [Pseudomonas syringae]|uniref:HTH-type transcriptional repressor AllR n=1 Tax=Pseudomonas syringae pv. actinidiae TaxID=103796 RepID=A0A2V0Q6X6_PSESF|nr:IclR family transcriptional regulator [Pseudomonas syringae]BBI43230.1 transcriptional regulator KdgR [Pseudomonas syringae pv. actinidiae]GBH07987.1 DNA-binding transcriptional regulator [Pseudomonas syringae pv. actinidiae]
MADDISPTERAFLVLEFLAKRGEISINDLTQHMGMPKTSAHRLLGNLESFGYVRKLAGRDYVIAPRLLELSSTIARAAMVNAPVHSILMELTRTTGESCSLGVLVDNEMEYIDSAAADTRLTLQFQAGHRAPLYCTSSGRIALSQMSKRDLSRYLVSGPWQSFTPNTVTDPEQLAEIIDQTRSQGYAITDSEFTLGVIGAAVPVFTPEKQLMGCLSISAPQARQSEGQVLAMIPMMLEASVKISACMGVVGS